MTYDGACTKRDNKGGVISGAVESLRELLQNWRRRFQT